MQDVITKSLGLVSQFSPLSVQPGSLARANNVVNLRENVYEDRRGYKVDATLSNNIKNVFSYQNKVLAHNGSTISYGMGTYADYAGTYSEPTGQIIRAQEASGNLYFTSSQGMQAFTDVSGTQARRAGCPRALDPSYTLNAAGTGFLANSSQCAYRVLIQRTDPNKNTVTGYPSQRLWVINSSGSSKNIDLKVYLPSEVQSGDIIQFYRTAQQTGTSTDTAADEMGLIYQYQVTAGDVSTGFITFTDSITDSLRGATLYTSPSQEGIGQANERPPLCKDVALFRSMYMFFSNTQTRQRLYFSLVGTSSLSGKTITLGGVTYNFGATEIVSGGGAPQIQVSSTGVAAFDIDQTARSLVRVVNRYSSNTTVYAYYQSGPSDLPGQIVVEERGIGGSSFTIQGSDSAISTMFYPNLPISPATSALSTSSNSVQKNALFYSKAQQHEHVPLANYLLVGPSSKEILRIVPLRESLIIIKEEGVYRLTGDSPQNFSITPLDLTVFCRALNSVAVVANQAIMLSNQGVVSISETGISVVSHEIEPMLKPLLTKSNLSDVTSAFGYESDRQYLLSTVSDPSDSSANQTLVFNVATRTWCRWTFAIKNGFVDPQTDKLYFCKYSDPTVYVERKSYQNDDYADPESAITITSISGQRITFTLAGVTPQVGWVITQGSTSLPIVGVEFIVGGFIATVLGVVPASWTTGAAFLFPSVGFDVEWNPWTGNAPGSMKQVRAVKFLADSTPGASSSSQLGAVFLSNFDSTEDEVTLTQDAANWGSSPWGSFAWGGGADSFGYPTWVPRNKQYCTRLTVGLRHRKALEKLSICGLALDFEMIGDRIGR